MNIQEINSEIDRLEVSQTNYENCSKLSILYIIRDHMAQPKNVIAEYSNPTSEFLSVVGGAPINDVLLIIDEHLNCMKLLYPKEYLAIINKIRNL